MAMKTYYDSGGGTLVKSVGNKIDMLDVITNM